MDELTGLDCFAEQQGFRVCRFPLPKTGSMSLLTEDGECFIGLDSSIPASLADRTVHLAHELGHCVTGSFYNRWAACDLRQKHENRADRWAIRRLVDPERLYDDLAAGWTEPWELAERFGVTEPFMRRAMAYYLAPESA